TLWGDHCATMFIDKNYEGWVWDAWDTKTAPRNLIPFNNWAIKKNEPPITKIMIANQSVVSDTDKGKLSDSSHFMSCYPETHINALQAMFSSAVPNHPEHPLKFTARNQFRLFKSFNAKTLVNNKEDKINKNHITPLKI